MAGSTVIQFVDPATNYVLALPNGVDALLVPLNYLNSPSSFIAPSSPDAHVLCSASTLSTPGNLPCYLTASGGLEVLENAADVQLLPVPAHADQVYISINKRFLQPPPLSPSGNAVTPFTALLTTTPYAWTIVPGASACVLHARSSNTFIAFDTVHGFTITPNIQQAAIFETVNWNLVLSDTFVAADPPSVMMLCTDNSTAFITPFTLNANRVAVTATTPTWASPLLNAANVQFPGSPFTVNGAVCTGVSNAAALLFMPPSSTQDAYVFETVPLLTEPFVRQVFHALPLAAAPPLLSTAAIAGIAVGCAIVIVSIALCAVYIPRQQQRRRRSRITTKQL